MRLPRFLRVLLYVQIIQITLFHHVGVASAFAYPAVLSLGRLPPHCVLSARWSTSNANVVLHMTAGEAASAANRDTTSRDGGVVTPSSWAILNELDELGGPGEVLSMSDFRLKLIEKEKRAMAAKRKEGESTRLDGTKQRRIIRQKEKGQAYQEVGKGREETGGAGSEKGQGVGWLGDEDQLIYDAAPIAEALRRRQIWKTLMKDEPLSESKSSEGAARRRPVRAHLFRRAEEFMAERGQKVTTVQQTVTTQLEVLASGVGLNDTQSAAAACRFWDCLLELPYDLVVDLEDLNERDRELDSKAEEQQQRDITGGLAFRYDERKVQLRQRLLKSVELYSRFDHDVRLPGLKMITDALKENDTEVVNESLHFIMDDAVVRTALLRQVTPLLNTTVTAQLNVLDKVVAELLGDAFLRWMEGELDRTSSLDAGAWRADKSLVDDVALIVAITLAKKSSGNWFQRARWRWQVFRTVIRLWGASDLTLKGAIHRLNRKSGVKTSAKGSG